MHSRGLINQVMPATDLEQATTTLVDTLLAKSPAVLRITKNALRDSYEVPFHQALWHAEEIYREQLLSTEDCREGVQAYLAKRKPQWRGK